MKEINDSSGMARDLALKLVAKALKLTFRDSDVSRGSRSEFAVRRSRRPTALNRPYGPRIAEIWEGCQFLRNALCAEPQASARCEITSFM